MAAREEPVRRRRAGARDAAPDAGPDPGREVAGCRGRLREGTFWLTRVVLLRALAFVYSVAFLVALCQNKQLIGERGLLPCHLYLRQLRQHFHARVGWEAVSTAPTLLWLLDPSHMNSNLDALALLGLGISAFVLLTGCANMVLMATLWVLYTSLVNVGQIWYAFEELFLEANNFLVSAETPGRILNIVFSGWEAQLLETGFLGVFLCPLWTLSRLPRWTPTPWVVVWGYRWLIFRIMLGAGLIKLRGDKCWWNLTCMDFHYETQPVPNPMAYFLHHLPWWFHRLEALSNHFLELVVPFFLILGRRMCALHGALQTLFQVILILSGNLSFLNWLTMVPSIACFDDAALGFLFPSGPGGLKDQVRKMQEETRGDRPPPRYSCVVRRVVNFALGLLVAGLSVPVIINLLSSKQVMNSSFNTLRIVNTYGAFGSITKERTEVVLQGTASINASAPDALWEEYEFPCKPGSLWRRPCLASPYHHRLDWLMWFAAFQTYEQNEWMLHLAGKLLVNDPEATSLLAHNPFQGRAPPRWVRGEHFKYKFSRPGGVHAAEAKWWIRKRIGTYFPPLSLLDLKGFFQSRDWPQPEPQSGRAAAKEK